jgi:hypothetical protein
MAVSTRTPHLLSDTNLHDREVREVISKRRSNGDRERDVKLRPNGTIQHHRNSNTGRANHNLISSARNPPLTTTPGQTYDGNGLPPAQPHG